MANIVRGLVLTFLVALPAQAAVRKGSSVHVTLRSGASVDGRVIAETTQGLLVSTQGRTVLVTFADIVSVEEARSTTAPATPPPPSPPPSPPPLAPPPPPPAPREDDVPPTAFAPPVVAPAQVAEPGEGDRKLRLGAGVSFLAVPSVIWAFGFDGAVAFTPSTRWDVRGMINFSHAEDDYTASNVFLVGGLVNVWFGVYGLGGGAALGYSDFVAKRKGGWDDDSATVVTFGSPVKLRFGQRVRHELTLDLGASLFVTHEPKPFGRFGYTALF